MTNLSHHFRKETESLRLTAEEKQAMRSRLLAALGEPVASPYQRFFAPRAFAYAFMSLLVVGSSTVYAAQGSLPGTLLYPIKVGVTERMESALAVTPEAQFAVNVKLAERRIKEVETLAAQGTLDEKATREAEENFDRHSEKIEKAARESASRKQEAIAFATRMNDSVSVLDPFSENGEESQNAALMLSQEAVPAAGMRAAFVEEKTALPATSSSTTEERKLEKESVGDEDKEKKSEVRKNSKRFIEHVRAKVESLKEEHSSSGNDNERDSKTFEREEEQFEDEGA